MALAEAAQSVAREFEFSGEDVRTAVKEFLVEMSACFSSLQCSQKVDRFWILVWHLLILRDVQTKGYKRMVPI